MAVDVANLIESLTARVNPPGTDLYPNATDDHWVLQLTNAFWDGRVHRLFDGFQEDAASKGGPEEWGPGIITPVDAEEGYDDPDGFSTTDMDRVEQQVIVMWAAWRITTAKMISVKSVLKTKAGPVEYEAQQSATLLKQILSDLKEEIDAVTKDLKSQGSTSTVFDAVIERSWAIYNDEGWWVR